MSKVKLQLDDLEVKDVLQVLERAVAGYSDTHVPERVARLRAIIEKFNS